MQQRLFCQHFWVVSPSSGLYSKEVCRFCGAEREELNAFVVRNNKVVAPDDNPYDKRMDFSRVGSIVGGYAVQGSYRPDKMGFGFTFNLSDKEPYDDSFLE